MGDSISVINFKKVSNKDGETNSAKNDQCINTPRSTTINYPINLGDQLGNPPPEEDTGKVDRLRIENSENFENNAKTPILDAYAINFPQNADQVSDTKLIAEIDVTNNTVTNLPDNVDQVSNTKLIAEKTSKVDRPPQKAINLENGFTKNVVPKSPRSAFDDLIPSSYKPVINPLTDKAIEPLLVEKDTKFGAAKSVVLPLKKHKKELAVVINYKFPDGSIATEKHKILNKKEGEALAHEKISYWEQKELLNPSRRYRVRQMGDEEYIWVEGCKLIELAKPPIKQWYVFYSPLGERLRVAGDSEFEVEEL